MKCNHIGCDKEAQWQILRPNGVHSAWCDEHRYTEPGNIIAHVKYEFGDLIVVLTAAIFIFACVAFFIIINSAVNW
jgi:hypothetical protein